MISEEFSQYIFEQVIDSDNTQENSGKRSSLTNMTNIQKLIPNNKSDRSLAVRLKVTMTISIRKKMFSFLTEKKAYPYVQVKLHELMKFGDKFRTLLNSFFYVFDED